jgi:hypothetical protein
MVSESTLREKDQASKSLLSEHAQHIYDAKNWRATLSGGLRHLAFFLLLAGRKALKVLYYTILY